MISPLEVSLLRDHAIRMAQVRDYVPRQFRDAIAGTLSGREPRPATRTAWRFFSLLCEHPAGISPAAARQLLGVSGGTMRNAASMLRRYLKPQRIDLSDGREGYRLSDPLAARRELARLRDSEVARRADAKLW
jgi:hypothetical protein